MFGTLCQNLRLFEKFDAGSGVLLLIKADGR